MFEKGQTCENTQKRDSVLWGNGTKLDEIEDEIVTEFKKDSKV